MSCCIMIYQSALSLAVFTAIYSIQHTLIRRQKDVLQVHERKQNAALTARGSTCSECIRDSLQI